MSSNDAPSGRLRSALVAIALGVASITAAEQGTMLREGLRFPARRTADVAPETPPELPADSEQIIPSTIRVGGRTIARSRERVTVAGGDREWFFQRNTIDPRRASGALIIHAQRLIVSYEESDLLVALRVRGWTDVLAIGVGEQGAETTPGVSGAALEEPYVRFPNYRTLDVTEWLEGQ
jgi:hypothetical protein